MQKQNEFFSLSDPIFLVKITISIKHNRQLIDSTVYYRCHMTYDFLCRWLWYFEYIQARVKVANPQCSVDLLTARMNPTILLGEEFIAHRRATLLANQNKKLRALTEMPVDLDLFGFAQEERNEKIAAIQRKIELLEKGEIIFPVIPDYVNRIHEFI